MTKPVPRTLRCAIYTRVSTDHGLEQDFNSLDAQREAATAYVKSQAHEGWRLVKDSFDDGGFSGGSLERPALQRLLAAIRSRLIDVVVVYKVDRLTRSLADFAKLVEIFDAQGVSFVSVTQSFNTTTSMGRLTLNMLLSFAQFERDLTERELVEARAERVVVGACSIRIHPSTEASEPIEIAWLPPVQRRRREILAPANGSAGHDRGIKAEARTVLLRSIALGRRWVEQVLVGTSIDEIAAREGCTKQHVANAIPLAFLGPDVVRAIVDARLPRGISARRIAQPELEWACQWEMLGIRR
jgi:DNA invertase Pin-like site-specific DNA recombinase